MRSIALLLIVMFLFCSCATQPNCGGNDVKAVLFGMINNKVKKHIEESYFEENYSSSGIRQYARDNGFSFKEARKKARQELKKKASVHASIEIKKRDLRIAGFRSDIENPKQCKCILTLNDGGAFDTEYTLQIEYMAQHTEDSKIYVEINGISNIDFYYITK